MRAVEAMRSVMSGAKAGLIDRLMQESQHEWRQGADSMHKKILIVDDDWIFLQLLKFKLTKRGFTVLTARNEREFWNQAFDGDPDLMIIDLLFKDKMGHDVYDNIIEFGFNPDIPVIFMSAHIDPKIAKFLERKDRFLLYSKTGDFEELVAGIERSLFDQGEKHDEHRHQTAS